VRQPCQELLGFGSVRELCFPIVRESCLTTTLKWREAKHQKLGMSRPPMMEINAEASDVLSAHALRAFIS
jgi:hypothetical protein